KPRGVWQKLLQEPKPLWHKLDAHRGDTSDVAARPTEARDKAGSDRIGADAEDDRDRRGCSLCNRCRECGDLCDNYLHTTTHQIGCQVGEPLIFIVCPSEFDRHVPAFDVADFAQALTK